MERPALSAAARARQERQILAHAADLRAAAPAATIAFAPARVVPFARLRRGPLAGGAAAVAGVGLLAGGTVSAPANSPPHSPLYSGKRARENVPNAPAPRDASPAPPPPWLPPHR